MLREIGGGPANQALNYRKKFINGWFNGKTLKILT